MCVLVGIDRSELSTSVFKSAYSKVDTRGCSPARLVLIAATKTPATARLDPSQSNPDLLLLTFQSQNEEPPDGQEKIQHGSQKGHRVLDSGNCLRTSSLLRSHTW